MPRADLGRTLEDTAAFGTAFTLVDNGGAEYPVAGTVGDIGISVSPATGERIRSRSIACACRIRTPAAFTPEVPGRGWRARIVDVNGNVTHAYVQGCDADRTLGVYNITLSLEVEVECE